MNRERSESQRRLLNDVLREEDGARQTALAAFRRARFVRRIGQISALVILTGTLTIGILLSQRDSTSDTQTITANGSSTNVRHANDSTDQREVPTLTDEQLLASFPPNSCFLAEIDGRQVLVFMDAVVERQVLRRGSSDQTRETY